MLMESDIKARLNAIDVQKLIETQRRHGRKSIPVSLQEEYAELHIYALRLLEDTNHAPEVRHQAHLLHDITASLARLRAEPLPTYYSYTDAHLLDWFIGSAQSSFGWLKERAAAAIYHLLHDLLHFEADSLAGFHTISMERFDENIAVKRLKAIKSAQGTYANLVRDVGGTGNVTRLGVVHYASLEGYASEATGISALIHFSCFPQTCFHDEVTFLRVIHLSELCFFGIRITIIEAIEDIRQGLLEQGKQRLQEACDFASMLHKAFVILRTMPPEHFADFRGATGNASAVQSRNYQLMDVHFRGFDSEKRGIFGRVPHLRFLNRYDHPDFLHLGRIITGREEDPGWSKVFAMAHELDQRLKTWRGFHLAFAKAYLPPSAPGTGATEGAPYLQKFLLKGLFNNTEVDIQAVQDLFPSLDLLELFRVPTTKAIAPPMNQTAGTQQATTEQTSTYSK